VASTTDWWEKLYKSSEVSQLPWYTTDLDGDIATALKAHGPAKGRVLDLGTGPGVHAIGLSRLGYDVVGSDISPSAIKGAKAAAGKSNAKVEFRVDNILKSNLEDQSFDAIVDRGTFHVLPPEARPRYVSTVYRILRTEGLLYLKTFSDKEPGDYGPYRLSPGELRAYFRELFHVVSIEDSVFQGTLEPAPRALFAIFRRWG